MAIITKHFVKRCDRIGLGVRRRLLGLWFDLCQPEAGVLAARIVAPVGNASQLGAGSVSGFLRKIRVWRGTL